MLKGTIKVDNTIIWNFNGLFEIFASEAYFESCKIQEGVNEFENNIMLLSAS